MSSWLTCGGTRPSRYAVQLLSATYGLYSLFARIRNKHLTGRIDMDKNAKSIFTNLLSNKRWRKGSLHCRRRSESSLPLHLVVTSLRTRVLAWTSSWSFSGLVDETRRMTRTWFPFFLVIVFGSGYFFLLVLLWIMATLSNLHEPISFTLDVQSYIYRVRVFLRHKSTSA